MPKSAHRTGGLVPIRSATVVTGSGPMVAVADVGACALSVGIKYW
ncbi:hypothetical protein SAMN04490239_1246 [Rhodococcus koreensis]|uniref:Uncharacterized protein n=1 Tax=Rhodococcus koreensis TaxID=99653 RepID=A0A1H4LF53_9NOCA|nr:hypothetical protein SAMN04490239_1246 [Rhodococcus koreensis]